LPQHERRKRAIAPIDIGHVWLLSGWLALLLSHFKAVSRGRRQIRRGFLAQIVGFRHAVITPAKIVITDWAGAALDFAALPV
jgi:hypothetical protein